MKSIKLYGMAAFALAAAGCATSVDFDGPRPGETWHVSTETLPLRERPDAQSRAVRALAYRDAVVVQKDVRVAPAFSGDRKLFPEDLIPCWARVSANGQVGYLPIASLASDWLIANQNPNETISDEGMTVAKRGFSESETDDELASMRGAAGAGKVAAKADMAAVERALAGQRKVTDAEVAAFVSEGQLAGKQVAPVELAVEARGGASTFAVGAGRLMSQGLNTVATAAGQDGSDGGRLVSATGKAAAGMVHSEIGPVQEFQLGKNVASRIFPLYRAVDPSDPRAVYVSRVGTALALASNDPMPYHGYVFALVESDEVNAFAVPGGFVFVTTAMLDFLKDEDELAAIIGHEMGHMELRHGVKAVGNAHLHTQRVRRRDREPGGLAVSAALRQARVRHEGPLRSAGALQGDEGLVRRRELSGRARRRHPQVQEAARLLRFRGGRQGGARGKVRRVRAEVGLSAGGTHYEERARCRGRSQDIGQRRGHFGERGGNQAPDGVPEGDPQSFRA